MRRVAFGLAVAALAMPVAMVTAMAGEAEGSEPYGGCKEVRPAYVQTPGADDCRADGWIIRKRIAVSPRGRVLWNTLPVCDAPEIRRSEAHCWVPFHRVAGWQRAYIVDTVSPRICRTTMIARPLARRSDAPTAV